MMTSALAHDLPFSTLVPEKHRNSVNGFGSHQHSQASSAKHADLRGRGLTQLPAFGKEMAIQAVDLSKNSITSLESAPEDLPEDLKSLSLASNRLSDLFHLKYLTACTALIDLDISDNPVANAAVRIGFDLRLFVLFLLPRLQRLNGQNVRQPQLVEASRALFTDVRGQLSDRLLELLEEGRQVELTHYLMQQCPLVKRPRHVDTAPNTPRAVQTSQTPRNPQIISYDDVPVGGSARRGTSYSAGPSASQDSFSRRGKGDIRGLESAPVSPRYRTTENAIMGFGGFGGMTPVLERGSSPRQATNRTSCARTPASKGRQRETGVQNEGSPRTSPRAPERAQFLSERSYSNDSVKENRTRQKSRAGDGVAASNSGRSTHQRPLESPESDLEGEMVKRLVTAELLATSSSSQMENLAGNVRGQSRDLSDVRKELSGVQKELQHLRTQGHNELAELWAELTEVRSELRVAHAAAEQARTELKQVRAELEQVQTDLQRALTDISDSKRDAAARRTEHEGMRIEVAEARTEVGAVRTELTRVRTDSATSRTALDAVQAELAGAREELRTGADARAVFEEALRRMWAECLHLRAWKDAQTQREAERAASRVQRLWRAWRARQENRRIEEALRPRVVKIQALVRGFLQRRRTSVLRLRSAAAVLIQAAVRGFLRRKQFRSELLNDRKERWVVQEQEMLRAQVYQMQLWMHQMATAITSAPPFPVPRSSQQRQ